MPKWTIWRGKKPLPHWGAMRTQNPYRIVILRRRKYREPQVGVNENDHFDQRVIDAKTARISWPNRHFAEYSHIRYHGNYCPD